MEKIYGALLIMLLAFTAATCQEDGAPPFDVSNIALSADKPSGFAPAGWKLEKVARGDLNGDGKVDYAITLIEDEKFDTKDRPPFDGNRILIVAFAKGNRLQRIAAADKLLQCSSCGGAFYGVIKTPAAVTIAKGVVIVNQQHGSRELIESTFRFRYDPQTARFLLIGYDYEYYDRAEGKISTESTNNVTGVRVITHEGVKRRKKITRTKVKPTPIYLDGIVADDLETAAGERLGVG